MDPIAQSSTTPNPSPLLLLPYEIRHIILDQLLTQRSHTSDTLPRYLPSPALPLHALSILLTNRQLHAEALPFLYSPHHPLFLEVRRQTSAFFCGVSGSDAYAFRAIYLGRIFERPLITLPAAITKSVRKVNVQVWAHRSDGDFYRVDRIQAQMRLVGKLIKRFGASWTDVNVRMCTSLGDGNTSLLDVRANWWPQKIQPAYPLMFLRGKASVTCYGVDADDMAQLVTAMTSATPALDLDELYDDFEALIRGTLPPPPPPGTRRTETEFLLIRATQEGERLLYYLETRCGPLRDRADTEHFMRERRDLAGKMRDMLVSRAKMGALPLTLEDPGWVLRKLGAMLREDELEEEVTSEVVVQV